MVYQLGIALNDREVCPQNGFKLCGGQLVQFGILLICHALNPLPKYNSRKMEKRTGISKKFSKIFNLLKNNYIIFGFLLHIVIYKKKRYPSISLIYAHEFYAKSLASSLLKVILNLLTLNNHIHTLPLVYDANVLHQKIHL